MCRIVALMLLVLAQVSIGSASAACTGADPAVVSAVVTGTTSDGHINKYFVTGKVTNVGHQGQASNVLQSVDIYEQENKADAKSIPPLKAGQSYTFSYVYIRSTEAGTGTTNLILQLHMHQPPSSPGSQNCSTSNDRFVLKV
jgi:hypothetical protein